MPVIFAADDVLAGGGWGPVPGELELNPTFTRANIRGGPDVAEIEATGPENALEETLGWLRRPVVVKNDNGMEVWWGFVNEVRLAVGAATYTLTLDAVANRIAVAYADYSPDGSTERKTTLWAQDDASVARFGTKEYLDSGGTMADAQALARRTRLLNDMAMASAAPSLSANQTNSAMLICVGWLETLLWRTYSRIEGRVEFDGDSGRVQPIGWGILSDNNIGFGDSAIHDRLGRLGALQEGLKVAVSGTANNNISYTVKGGSADEIVTYAANTIYFQLTDDIYDSAQGMGPIKASHYIYITGSVLNSGYHFIEAAGAGALNVDTGPGGQIELESAGPLITITQASRLDTYEAGVYELPGPSVTMVLTGSRLAQSFTVPTTMQLAQVAVKVGKVGIPADSFQVDIYSNSGGNPGTLLGTALLSASAIDDSPNWRWLITPVITLTAGTTYWLVCGRQSTLNGANHYTVQMTTDAYGTCKAWNGGAWITNPLGEYLPLKVWSGEDTAAQMKRIITGVGEFFADADVPASTGIVTNPYRDEDETAYDALFKLFDSGTSGGQRLHAWVSPARTLSIYAEPSATDDPAVYGTDGVLRQALGGLLPQGYLPVGQWVIPEGLSPAVRAAIRVSPLLVEEAEYDWREQVLRINRVRRLTEGR